MTIRFANTPYAYRLPSPREMSAYDNATIKAGVPSLELMERAGLAMTDSILKEQISKSNIKRPHVLIVVGPGNNGGDGLVVARLLRRRDISLTVIISAARRYSNDHISRAREFVKEGGELLVINDIAQDVYVGDIPHKFINEGGLSSYIGRADFIVDALLGTGQKSAPIGSIKVIVKAISKANRKVIALDMPTGVDAETGAVHEAHLRAEFTLTVELVKRGMLQYPARDVCGVIEVVSIGIDCSNNCEYNLLNLDQVKLPKRKKDSHKGLYGHVLVIGGSKEYPGAPVLSAHSALRSGAGLVSLCQFSSIRSSSVWPEIIIKELNSKDGFFTEKHAADLKKMLQDKVVVLGPGLSMRPATIRFTDKIIEFLYTNNIPTVLDADGLNILSKLSKKYSKRSLNCFVMTPHPGEMANLLGITTAEVQLDRYKAAKDLASKFNCTVVLKGAASIVYACEEGLVNSSGNAYMATAGSGDVLAGVIASLIAQNQRNDYGIRNATAAAVFLHGLAGDMAHSEKKGPIIASDIISHLSTAISQCTDL